MSFDLKKAVQRFQFRLSKDEKGNLKTFKVNDTDIQAFNSILQHLNQVSKESVLNNVLFTKLYIYHKTMNIRHYGTTVLDEFNEHDKDLIRLFKTPINLFYEGFYKDLQDNQLNKLVTEEDKEAQNDIWKEYLRLKETFTLENVSAKLGNEISSLIINYSDKSNEYKKV